MCAARLKQSGIEPAHPNCLQDNGVIKASCPCEPCAPRQQRCFYCWFHGSLEPLLNHTSVHPEVLAGCALCLLYFPASCFSSHWKGEGNGGKCRQMLIFSSKKKTGYKSYLIQLETVREKRLQCFQQQDRSVLLGKEVRATECQLG